MNIAYAILDEAEHVDVALLDFIMRGRQQARLSQHRRLRAGIPLR